MLGMRKKLRGARLFRLPVPLPKTVAVPTLHDKASQFLTGEGQAQRVGISQAAQHDPPPLSEARLGVLVEAAEADLHVVLDVPEQHVVRGGLLGVLQERVQHRVHARLRVHRCLVLQRPVQGACTGHTIASAEVVGRITQVSCCIYVIMGCRSQGLLSAHE